MDDDAFAHYVLALLLEEARAPIKLSWVDTIEKALDFLGSEPVDVCLLDYQLGSRSGLELLAALKRLGSRVPVVMLTAHTDRALDLDAMRAGAVDYLIKGEFTAATLERVVRYAADRARTLDRLHESEERYALAVTGSNDGIWDWKLGQPQVFFSERWRQLLGLAAGDLADTMDGWYSRVHVEDRRRLRSAFEAHTARRVDLLEVEVRMQHHNGSWHWVLVRGTAVRDAEGRATRIAGSLTDITTARSRDPLTSLANRALYLDRLGQALTRAKRDVSRNFAVLFLDCDRFKLVNDSLGHAAGDALLVSIARRLESCVREIDTVARFGGDEFAVLLEDAREPDGAVRVAERIIAQLARPFVIQDREVFIGASVGIAMSRATYTKPEEMLRDADTSMYRAKALGGGRVAVFDEQMHARALAMLQLEGELRRAVEAGQLEVHYQPVVSMPGERLVGFEALVRWRHPTKGLIPPDSFIPLAEETGVITAIDRWVLAQACAQLVRWRGRPGCADLTLAVNASPRQLDAPGAAEAILAVIAASSLPPAAVVLEVTETLAKDHPQALANLTQLEERGLKIVMDDFGTGYSSLAALHRLPFTGLKIDRSFVARLEAEVPVREVVRAAVSLGTGLGLSVTAEGIETAGQLELLQKLGCARFQGYRFGKPRPAAELGPVLEPGARLLSALGG